MATKFRWIRALGEIAVRRRSTPRPPHRHISHSQPSHSEASSSLDKWQLGKVNHVAIAVPDLDGGIELYRDVLGAKVSEVVPLPEHGVYTVFVDLGNTKIEAPLHSENGKGRTCLGENSPIASFLKKKPEGGMHHICIEVDDIQAAMRDLQGKVRPLTTEPKIGAHGKPVVFLHPKDCNGVLLELEET